MGDLRNAYDTCAGAGGLTKVQTVTALFMAGSNPTGLEVADFWEKNTKQDDDKLSFDEFKNLHDNQRNAVELIRESFNSLDKDGNGTIDRDELKALLKKSDESVGMLRHADDSFIDAIIRSADDNDDKVLDLNELVDAVAKNVFTP